MAAQKTIVIGAGPVGSLAALYAAGRGDDVELYELRGGECLFLPVVPRAMFAFINTCLYFCLIFNLINIPISLIRSYFKRVIVYIQKENINVFRCQASSIATGLENATIRDPP